MCPLASKRPSLIVTVVVAPFVDIWMPNVMLLSDRIVPPFCSSSAWTDWKPCQSRRDSMPVVAWSVPPFIVSFACGGLSGGFDPSVPQ